MRLTRKSLLGLLLASIVILAISRSLWLAALGQYLVKAEAPTAADAAVILAGDATGDRVRKGIELLRADLIPLLVISGPCCLYGRNEGELAVEQAVREGARPDWFVVVPMRASSTREEAVFILDFLRKRGFSSFLLVTSDYHTRRAGNIYRKRAGDLRFRVIAAPERRFRAGDWWRSREGQKVFLGEWERTVANWVGL